jgi:hypothetical protein
MPIYSAFSVDAKVLGEIVLAFLRCMNYDNVAPFMMRHGLLGRHGFQTVDPEQWYSQQGWLSVLSDLTEERPDSSSDDLLSIGMKMFETIVFPPGFESLPVDQALVDWGALYAEKHRGTDIGEVTAELVSDRHFKMRTRVPYPDGIQHGLFYAMLRHFCPEGMDFDVAYDESVLRRDHGGEITVYDIILRPRDSEFDPETEVSGRAMLALIRCIVADEIADIVKRHGIDSEALDPEAWYPLQTWLDVLQDVLGGRGFHGTLSLVDIGRTYAKTAYVPDGINTLEDALVAVNDTYQLNHRNGYAGELSTTILGPGHLQVVDHTPYPEDYTYGFLYGLAHRFKPAGVHPIVQHDDEAPCRKRGDDSCTYDITWE